MVARIDDDDPPLALVAAFAAFVLVLLAGVLLALHKALPALERMAAAEGVTEVVSELTQAGFFELIEPIRQHFEATYRSTYVPRRPFWVTKATNLTITLSVGDRYDMARAEAAAAAGVDVRNYNQYDDFVKRATAVTAAAEAGTWAESPAPMGRDRELRSR